tara:strand:- start:156 stop:317 length:162 start_codon:yes stop_codon:yes gene_type:complete
MKKTAFNLNLIAVLAFVLLSLLSYTAGTEILTPIFVACVVVFLMILPACSKTN